MTDDLISRADAISIPVLPKEHRKQFKNFDDAFETGWNEALSCINVLPSAQPRTGEWIDMGDFERCSFCNGTHLKEIQTFYGKATWIKTPYCPNCGARMKGADDER